MFHSSFHKLAASLLSVPLLLGSCTRSMLRLPATPTVATLTAANPITSLTTMPGIPTLASTATSPGRVFTPQATNMPWIFPSGLSIEEHPLAKQPEIEPLVILPLDGLTQAEVMDRHKDL